MGCCWKAILRNQRFIYLLRLVENLYEIKSNPINSNLSVGVIYKIGKICILMVDSNEIFNGVNYGSVLFKVPVGFRPTHTVPAPVGFINSTNSGAVHIENNGNVIWRGGSNTSGAMYINITYLVADF